MKPACSSRQETPPGVPLIIRGRIRECGYSTHAGRPVFPTMGWPTGGGFLLHDLDEPTATAEADNFFFFFTTTRLLGLLWQSPIGHAHRYNKYGRERRKTQKDRPREGVQPAGRTEGGKKFVEASSCEYVLVLSGLFDRCLTSMPLSYVNRTSCTSAGLAIPVYLHTT